MSSDLLKILKNIPILNNADEEDLAEVADKGVLKKFKKGEYVMREGEQGETFYIIKSGKVEVLRKNKSGEEEIVSALYPDNFFGEMALLKDEPRNASVRCIEDSEVYVFDKTNFFNLLYL